MSASKLTREGLNEALACGYTKEIDEHVEAIEAENKRMHAALTQIAKGEGPFSRDQHAFACNVIENLKRIATEALTDIQP